MISQKALLHPSPTFFLSALSAAETRTIPFDLSGVPDADGIPSGWSLKQWFGKSRKIEVIREAGTPVLHVRESSKDDQAAQLYVMFPRSPAAINNRLVGYIWDSSAPAGARATSRKSSNTRYVILPSGKERLGEWFEEKRNVYADYKDLFGEEPPKGGGIILMIDSDDTKSSAESFFSDIRLQSAEGGPPPSEPSSRK